MKYLYLTEQIRTAEHAAVAQLGVSLAQLMQRAAQACLVQLQAHHAAPAKVTVICGPGNNGGDGWVLARLARQAGYQVQVFAAPPQTELAQLAARAWHEQGATSQPLTALSTAHVATSDVIVDALFGRGLNRPVTADYAQCIDCINSASQRGWVMSVDVPSGLCSDTGQPRGCAVKADCTVVFIGLTMGLVTGQAAHYGGKVVLAELGIATIIQQQTPLAEVLDGAHVSQCLPPRQATAHKGHFGHLLIIGGGPGMSGAAVLAGRAALRTGAGKVSIACHSNSQTAIAAAQPELMVHSAEEAVNLLLGSADVVVIGPGLGQSAWAQQLVAQVCQWSGTIVWDADALNLLATMRPTKPTASEWLFTPHPGEAGRLLGLSTATIEENRWQALTQICQNFQAHALLKGAGTLVKVANQSSGWVCRRGSPALATGGSGDVLSGVLGALLAQRLPVAAALTSAVWVHAVAGELAAGDGERGTIASDLLAPLRQLVNPAQWSQHLGVIDVE